MLLAVLLAAVRRPPNLDVRVVAGELVAIHWNRLLEFLISWADAREVTGGIEVTFRRCAGGRRTVELVLTPDEWDSLVSVVRRDTPGSVKDRILALPEGQPFLGSSTEVGGPHRPRTDDRGDSLPDFEWSARRRTARPGVRGRADQARRGADGHPDARRLTASRLAGG